ncbi:MAG: hypothetical protein H6985_11265 [Pseudomonadales bacterium]|nr:hypothetical protein [Pseudomonadales bacterium]
MSQESILSVLQASDGTLWIANLAGVSRYQGGNLTMYRPQNSNGEYIASSSIVTILESIRGTIFVATKDAGLLIFDESENRFQSLDLNTEKDPIYERISAAFLDEQGELWLGYESGNILRYSTMRESINLPGISLGSRIVDFTQSPSNTVYIATGDNNLFRVMENSHLATEVELTDSCRNSFSDLEEISAISTDTIWLGTSGSGLLIFDSSTGNCQIPKLISSQAPTIARSHIHEILVDRENNVTWAGSDQGLYRIDSDFSVLRFSTENSNLTENEVSSISPYKNNIFWIGTYKGLNYLVPTAFESYNGSLDKRLRSIVAIASSNEFGSLVASYNGLLLFDATKEVHRNPSEANSILRLIDNQIMSLHVSAEGIWIGYRAAGLQFLGVGESNEIHTWRYQGSPELSSDSVSAILSTKDGKVLVGTYGGGLNIVSLEEDTQVYSVGNNRVIMLFESMDGTIWIGTESGLFSFNLKTRKLNEIALRKPDDTNQTHPVVWDMVESEDGDLWLATMHHGLFIWTREGQVEPSAHSIFPVLNPSSSFSTVYSLEMDNQGFIWSSTDSGLVRIDSKTKEINIFSKQHGLQQSEFDFGVSHKDKLGYLYFGGSDGYTKFDPKLLDEKQNTPEIVLTKMVLADLTLQSIRKLSELHNLQLTHNDYFVQFNFSVLDFLDPEKNQYRYMLEGFDPDWLDNGTRNTATYTSLPPGDYIFRVQGANSAGVWNRDGISLAIEVLPPPWLTWWAFTGYALVLMFLLWLGTRAYVSFVIQRVAKQMAVRMVEAEERADDEMQEQLEIHDDLVKSVYMHSVSTLNLVSECLAIKGSSLADTDAQASTDSSVKRVLALATLEDCLYYQNEILLADLNKYTDVILHDLLKESPVGEESIITINEVMTKPFPIEQASVLAIALYELLENSVQHAFEDSPGANYLHITLAAEQSEQPKIRYRLTVQDNGLGIPPNIDTSEAQTPGLMIVAAMTKRLSGVLTFTVKNGTIATITFPGKAAP